MTKKIILIVAILFTLCQITYAATPVIFYTDIISGPNTGGENNNGAYLTISGNGFGATRGTSTVKINGGEVSSYIVWSDTKVSVQLGSAISTGNIVLQNADGSSTGPDAFTVRSGNFYFVSLSGTDNGSCGAIGTPCRTPNYVRTNRGLTAGDFIYIRGGNYDLNDGTNNLYSNRWVSASIAGTTGNPITVSGYPGEIVNAISDTGQEMWMTGQTVGVDYGWWVVANLKHTINSMATTGGNGQTLQVGVGDGSCPNNQPTINYSRFVNIETYAPGGVSDSGGSPFTIGNCNYCKILGFLIHDSIDHGQTMTHVIYLAGVMHDVEVAYGEIYNMLATRAAIQVHHDSFNGSCWSSDGSVDPITYNVDIHDNKLHDLYGQAILVDGGAGFVRIYNNIIWNTNQVTNPFNATNRGDQVIAIRSSGSRADVEIYNNTLYVNPKYTSADAAFGFGYSGGCPERVLLKNNIVALTEGQDIYWESNSYPCNSMSFIDSNTDYNIWYGSTTQTTKPSWDGTHSSVVNPQFVDTVTSDFHLQNTSPAKDAGTTVSLVTRDYDGISRPQNSIYDIGAYEYSPNQTGVASQIVFTAQPSGGTAGVAWTTQPTVEIRDADNNTVNGDYTVTLTISSNPGNGILICSTNPIVIVGGSSGSSSGCQIDIAGTDYNLLSSAAGLNGSTSNMFNIAYPPITGLQCIKSLIWKLPIGGKIK